MTIIENVMELEKKLENTYVAIGTFDGVHFGHQELIKRAVENAKKNNGLSVVFTFSSHPLELINKERVPRFINTIEEKKTLLESFGVDVVVLQPFNEKFASLKADEFVDLLKDKLGCKEIFVGFNFSFGIGGKGTPKDLIRLGEERGILVHEIPAVYLGDKLISSTFVRTQVPDGDIEDINRYLGHNFLIQGEVIHGKKLARVLGFPTINIEIANRIYPKNGVYGARVRIEGENFYRYGVANIGVNPTLKPGEKSVEVNIFDFDQTVYGKIVEVELMKYIRPEEKFDSVEELIKNIGNDVKTWREIINARKS